MKLGVIVPYRDRKEHLDRFIPYMKQYFYDEQISDYEIIIVEQMGKKPFNRGSLLNIGFLEAEELGCDYVVFHDVDMLPVEADYTYTDKVTQIACTFKPEQKISYDYFGGVTLFPSKLFRAIGGYSNRYKGWGYEDNDLLLRCLKKNLPLGSKFFTQPCTHGQALEFTGESYVEFRRPVDFRKSCLIYVDFVVDRLDVDLRKGHDECSIFSIPGLDITLAYTGFGTYKFELFDTYEDVYSIHTEKMPPMHCKALIYYNEPLREFRFYLNGNHVGTKPLREGRRVRVMSNKLYLGVGNPVGTDKKGLVGKVLRFMAVDACTDEIFSRVLEEGISALDPTETTIWVDTEHYVEGSGTLENLSGNGEDGKVVGCQTAYIPMKLILTVPVPNHREGTFRLQKHEKNGDNQGSWKTWETRMNQALYSRRSQSNDLEEDTDGLVNIENIARWEEEYQEGNVNLVKVKFI